jgi:archaellum biogenesis ATPase FlaH
LKSSIESINNWIGEYPTKTLIGFFGEARAGKTIFLIQEAYNFLKNGNVLIIDTEYDKELFLKEWDEVFRKRFGVKDGEIYVFSSNYLEDIYSFFGIKAKNIIDKKTGKITLEFYGEEESKAEDYIVNKNVKMIIVDSVTEMFGTSFFGDLKNFPARTNAQRLIFHKLLRLAFKYNLYLFGVHHKSFIVLPVEKPEIRGGSEIRHLFKLWFFMEKTGHKKVELQSLRRLYLVRNFRVPDWKFKTVINLTDNGFFEISPEEIEEIIESKEVR